MQSRQEKQPSLKRVLPSDGNAELTDRDRKTSLKSSLPAKGRKILKDAGLNLELTEKNNQKRLRRDIEFEPGKNKRDHAANREDEVIQENVFKRYQSKPAAPFPFKIETSRQLSAAQEQKPATPFKFDLNKGLGAASTITNIETQTKRQNYTSAAINYLINFSEHIQNIFSNLFTNFQIERKITTDSKTPISVNNTPDIPLFQMLKTNFLKLQEAISVTNIYNLLTPAKYDKDFWGSLLLNTKKAIQPYSDTLKKESSRLVITFNECRRKTLEFIQPLLPKIRPKLELKSESKDEQPPQTPAESIAHKKKIIVSGNTDIVRTKKTPEQTLRKIKISPKRFYKTTSPSPVVADDLKKILSKELTQMLRDFNPGINTTAKTKVNLLLKDFPKLEQISSKISAADSSHRQESKNQVQRALKETLRMVSEQNKNKLIANPNPTTEVKILISKTLDKFSTLYGIKFPEKTDVIEQPFKKEEIKHIMPQTPSLFVKPAIKVKASKVETDLVAAPVSGFPIHKESDQDKKPDITSKTNSSEEASPVFPDDQGPALHETKKRERKLVVQSAYTISGRIIDRLSGRGIRGVYVNGGRLGNTLTDGDGDFRFYNVAQGSVYTISMLKKGYRFSPSNITDTADGPNRHYIKGYKI